MANITTIFFDMGGVLLTDGWNHISRKKAAEHFSYDFEEFEQKHKPLADLLDMGQISVNDYIDKTVFYKNRSFSKSDFYQFMKDQSEPLPGSLELAAKLAAQNKYYMGIINNESIELGLFRIDKFKLKDSFQVFCTSGFLGTKKPQALIFERALHVTQRKAAESVFIDDRAENLVAPRQLQMHTIQFQNPEQLTKELAAMGVVV